MELLAGTDLETIYTQSLHEATMGRVMPPSIVKFLAHEWAREYDAVLRFSDVAPLLAELEAGTRTAPNIYQIDRILIHDGVDARFYDESWQESLVRDGICAAYAALPPTDRERTYIRHEFSRVRSALRDAMQYVEHFMQPGETRLEQKLAAMEECKDLSFLR